MHRSDDHHDGGAAMNRGAVLLVAGLLLLAPGLAGATTSEHLGLSASPGGSVAPGETVTITISLENTAGESLNGVSIESSLPDGWTDVGNTTDGAAFKSSTTTWFWLSLGKDAAHEVSVTLAVPEDASPSEYDVEFVASDSDGGETTATATVTVTDGGGDGSSGTATGTEGSGGSGGGSGSGSGMPGFGVSAALLALLGTALVARRRT